MMTWTLQHDEATSELRLRATDLWDGNHERREWRVIRSDGSVVKRRGDLDGRAVYTEAPGSGFYIRHEGYDYSGAREYIQAEDQPIVDERIPCRRIQNPRNRKCAQCAA